MKNKITTLAIAAIAVFSACNNSPYEGYEMSDSGLPYHFFKHDENGAKPKEGDVVKIIMSYKNNKDSVLLDSRQNVQSGGVFQFPLMASTFSGSFEEAMMMMSVGDSATFLINADSLYTKMIKQPLPAYIEKGSMLTFNTKLVEIKAKEEVMKEQAMMRQQQEEMMRKQQEIAAQRKELEPKELEEYLKKNNIKTKPLASGLIFIEKSKGTGEKVQAGKTVVVHYKGMLLDGTVFDSSIERGQPAAFPIGVGQVIKGWDEAIPMMNVGGKAMLIIPSAIAYGDMGSPGVIPPCSSLVFEVEVLGVK